MSLFTRRICLVFILGLFAGGCVTAEGARSTQALEAHPAEVSLASHVDAQGSLDYLRYRLFSKARREYKRACRTRLSSGCLRRSAFDADPNLIDAVD